MFNRFVVDLIISTNSTVIKVIKINFIFIIEIRLEKPRDEGIVHKFDKPKAGKDGSNDETTCVITSTNGTTWKRPKLNLFLKDKFPNNNIVLANSAPVTHNFSPFLDTNKNTDKIHRFKSLGGTEKSGLIAYSSPDGIIWNKLRTSPYLLKAFLILKTFHFGQKVKIVIFVISELGQVAVILDLELLAELPQRILLNGLIQLKCPLEMTLH